MSLQKEKTKGLATLAGLLFGRKFGICFKINMLFLYKIYAVCLLVVNTTYSPAIRAWYATGIHIWQHSMLYDGCKRQPSITHSRATQCTSSLLKIPVMGKSAQRVWTGLGETRVGVGEE